MTAILHVISGLGTGGAETMLVQLASAMAKQGWRQHVVGLGDRDEYAAELRAQGVAVTILGLRSFAGAPLALVRLRGIVGVLSPSVIQGWMYHGDLFAFLAHVLSPGRDERRLLWNLRASNMDAARYARILRWNAWLSYYPDVVIANSEVGAEHHKALGYRPRRLEIVRNGIDIEKFRPDPQQRRLVREELGLPTDAVVAIHVARVDPMKDHPIFIATMTKLPGLTGLLVGRDTEGLTLPPNIRALGPRTDLSRLYAAADIVISTSAFGEGFSNVIGEGMSSGLVPIATEVGDARLIVGNAGHVVAPRDVAAITHALDSVGSMPPNERQALGLRSRQRIVENFSLASAVQSYLALYREYQT